MRWIAAMVATCAFGWGAGSSVAAGPRSGYALRPDHGIGPVSLGERKSRVEASLGRVTGACRTQRGAICLRRYDGQRGDLIVQYYAGRVWETGSSSGKITLGGIPLRRGPTNLRRQLRGWRHFRCEGLRIYEHGAGPGTAINFGSANAVDVTVSTQSFGGCGGQ